MLTLTAFGKSISAQNPYPRTTSQHPLVQSQSHAPKASEQRSFEVVSIRPIAPGGTAHNVGFHSLPGGRIEINGFGAKQLISEAFHLPPDQIKGGPDWLDTEGYVILAIPPDTSPSRNASQRYESSTPTGEQRLMLQAMLAERFALRYHRETRSGSTYVLTTGDGPLRMNPPQDKGRKPAFVLFMQGEVFDGETRGANVSIPEIAAELSFDLGTPVIDKTGLPGAYDFSVEPFAPDNKDPEYAAIGAMRRLGLKLQKFTAPTKVIVIDSIERPTPN